MPLLFFRMFEVVCPLVRLSLYRFVFRLPPHWKKSRNKHTYGSSGSNNRKQQQTTENRSGVHIPFAKWHRAKNAKQPPSRGTAYYRHVNNIVGDGDGDGENDDGDNINNQLLYYVLSVMKREQKQEERDSGGWRHARNTMRMGEGEGGKGERDDGRASARPLVRDQTNK
jgi:hypothetical protein